MKDKMKNTLEQEVELLGRSVSVLLIAGLLVVGGASAALLNSFGEITGDAEVDQAVYLQDNEETTVDQTLTASYNVVTEDDAFVAGQTFSDEFTAVNDAESPVEVEFRDTGENTEFLADDPSEGVVQEVYEVQTFDYVADGVETEIVEDDAVTVYPGVDELHVVASYDQWEDGTSSIDFEYTTGDGVPHIGYNAELDEPWEYAPDADDDDRTHYDSGSDLADAQGEVQSLEINSDGDLEITLSGGSLESQSFAMKINEPEGSGSNDPAASEIATPNWDNQYFDENDHETVDYRNFVDGGFNLGTEGQDYVLSTHFPVNTDPSEDFDFGVLLDVPAE